MAVDKNYVPSTDYPEVLGMKYDNLTHRYVLTADYILSEFVDNVDVLTGSVAKGEAMLKEISRQVYRWMYSQVLNDTRPVLEYLIAKDTEKAEAMKQAMAEQYRYARVSGGNLVAHQSGINSETGTTIDLNVIRQMKVSEEVKQTLETMGMTNQRISYRVSPSLIRADY